MIEIQNTKIIADSSINSDILNALNTLITTPTGTVALDRDYGLNTEFIDMPANRAKQIYSTEVTTKIRKYEPRISLKKIEFSVNPGNGILTPKLTITQV